LNDLCWVGSLSGYATKVLSFGEKAVEQAASDSAVGSKGAIRDSRGLARALAGNVDGAIDDFQAYVNDPGMASKATLDLRRRWIKQLQDGLKPEDIFTEKLLKALLNKSGGDFFIIDANEQK